MGNYFVNIGKYSNRSFDLKSSFIKDVTKVNLSYFLKKRHDSSKICLKISARPLRINIDISVSSLKGEPWTLKNSNNSLTKENLEKISKPNTNIVNISKVIIESDLCVSFSPGERYWQRLEIEYF